MPVAVQSPQQPRVKQDSRRKERARAHQASQDPRRGAQATADERLHKTKDLARTLQLLLLRQS